MKVTVQGGHVPNALCELGAGEQIYCESGVMVYSDPSVGFHMRPMTQGGLAKTLKRTLIGGIPYYMHTYLVPGYAACSRSAPGEIRTIELGAGETIDVAEHFARLARLKQ